LSAAEERTHSALHVLKGAVVKVLGPRKTASVHVRDARGRLTVVSERQPTPEEVAEIARQANLKVDENAELIEFEMERAEAEAHFGTAIYDAFPVPPDVGRLRLVRIPDWEVNCCTAAHVETTGEVGRIGLDAARFRDSKQLLELEFHIEG
jgi:alanyl-tRNA synthetase